MSHICNNPASLPKVKMLPCHFKQLTLDENILLKTGRPVKIVFVFGVLLGVLKYQFGRPGLGMFHYRRPKPVFARRDCSTKQEHLHNYSHTFYTG